MKILKVLKMKKEKIEELLEQMNKSLNNLFTEYRALVRALNSLYISVDTELKLTVLDSNTLVRLVLNAYEKTLCLYKKFKTLEQNYNKLYDYVIGEEDERRKD